MPHQDTPQDFLELDVRGRLLYFLDFATQQVIDDLKGFERMMARDAKKLFMPRVKKWLDGKSEEYITEILRNGTRINEAFVQMLTTEDGEAAIEGLASEVRALAGGADGNKDS